VRPADLIVRLEWLAVFLAAIVFYVFAGGGWLLFVLLILAPDLSMLGYLAGPRIGAFTYNMLHVMFWPLVLLAGGAYTGHALALQVAAIWLAHIAIDRALGYGLKYATGFQDTTLGRIGRRS
jgi:Domain of unknown function (DUF4260)